MYGQQAMQQAMMRVKQPKMAQPIKQPKVPALKTIQPVPQPSIQPVRPMGQNIYNPMMRFNTMQRFLQPYQTM